MGRKKLTKEELKARAKAQRNTPEAKAKRRARESTPEAKAKRRLLESKPKFKAWRRAYEKDYRKKPERLAQRREYDKEKRLKILERYSKLLSNSNIPCCNCCGESEIEFLAIDHIAGRRQMDSETELVKLGYSSKLDSHRLNDWIIKNDFPEGFQVLCHNCNFAKGKKGNNNTCPHERKRKEEAFAMMEEQSSFEV